MPSPSAAPVPPRHPAVAAALKDCRRAFWSVAVFSGVVNLLMLTGPIYMLQVYDRVLASHSIPTLVALTALVICAYGFQAFMDLLRNRVVVRVAGLLDLHLATVVHRAVVRIAINSRQGSEAHQPVRDLDQIRSFLTSAGPVAIVDLPWMPAFLFLCYLIHPLLGLLAFVGGLTLFTTTLLTERATREPSRDAAKGGGQRSAQVEADRRNSETIVAMGLGPALARRFTNLNDNYLGALQRSSDIVTSYGSISRALRMLLQSGMLGLGAYLVIRQELTPGSMIAASITMGRALAPIETAIANWRGFVAARDSVRRLSDMLARVGVDRARTDLPTPKQSFDIENVVVAPPDAQVVILNNINFKLQAGDVLGVVGPSGSGKTSLVRVIVGVWRPARGSVRIDGAALDQWAPEQLGPHIGFVAQAVELFDGTVTENIARMSVNPDADAVIRAARAAGAHDMILRFSAGYDTRIGEAGAILSAGQRQRIALARALYGDPFLVVLDEPNANLDSEGEAALLQAIRDAKARGAIVIMIAHRASALSVCDKLLFVRDGIQQAFGPRDAVMRTMMPQTAAAVAPPQPPAAAGGLKVVGDSQAGGVR